MNKSINKKIFLKNQKETHGKSGSTDGPDMGVKKSQHGHDEYREDG